MRVVYTPATRVHDPISETMMGRETRVRDPRTCRAHPCRPVADGGFELVGPTEHGSTRSWPSTTPASCVPRGSVAADPAGGIERAA